MKKFILSFFAVAFVATVSIDSISRLHSGRDDRGRIAAENARVVSLSAGEAWCDGDGSCTLIIDGKVVTSTGSLHIKW